MLLKLTVLLFLVAIGVVVHVAADVVVVAADIAVIVG
jgi:hypothetical protein